VSNEYIKKKTQKLFIEPLEQRIMLDGAGASTFLDLIDERNQQQITINSSNKDIYKEGENSNKDIPFTNITRDKIRNDKKNIVFIDSAVEDYETITSSFKENTEFYLINANEDGFKRISEILKDRENIDALHLIGHGSSGQILFGNAFLNNDTIDNYQSTLSSIGQSLTTSGDILFYGCNVASTEQGEILIKKISEITKADIAASDDITGKSGDWELEKKYGIIETENVKVLGYEDDLFQDGISARDGDITEYTGTNVSKSNSRTDISIKLEKQDVSVSSSSYVGQHSITSSISMSGSNSSGQMSYNSLRTFYQATGETSGTVNSYLVFHTSNNNDSGTVTFDGEIIGIFWDVSYIHSDLSNSRGSRTQTSNYASTVRALYNNSSLSYETNAKPGLVMENNSTGTGNSYTYRYGSSSNITNSKDRVSVTSSGSGTNNKLHMSVDDGGAGDYIRVIVKQSTNTDPTINQTTSNNFTEDSTSADAIVGVFDVDDTETADGSLSVAITSGNDNGYYAISYNSAGTATVTLTTAGANYVNAGNDLPSYTVTVTDGNSATATASHNPSVTTVNDAPTINQTTSNNFTEDSTSAGATVGVFDVDDEETADGSLSVAITSGNDNGYYAISYNSAGTATVTLTTAGANYVNAGNDLPSYTVTVTDGNSATATASHNPSVTTVNDAPTTVPDTDSVAEGGTVTNTTNVGTGTVVSDDSDEEGSTLSVSGTVTHTASDGSSVSGGNSDIAGGSSSIEGTYGTLTLDTDGSYSYVATTSSANALGAGDSGTDTFTFLVSDGTTTTSSTIQFTVNGVNDAPTARDDTGIVNEDARLIVSNSSDATSVAGASHDGTPYAIGEGSIRSLTFNHDGTKMFVVHASTPAVISEHALTTAFDITTASQSTTYDVSSHTTSPRGLRFNSDGTKLYLNSDESSNKKVYEFSLSTAYDISSLPTPSSTVISGQDGNPRGIAFNTDGSKMFLLGDENDTVYEYSLSTPFNTTTISYTNRSLDFSSKEVTPRGLSFNSTGTKLFITGQNSDDILEYDLSTGFNLSIASFNGAFDMTGTVSSPNDVVFNNDGSKAFIGQTGSNKIFSFSLSSPFSLVDITGENTGDVLDTSSSSNSDSDADASASLTVTAIRVGSSEDSGAAGSIDSALTGTYGQLTIAADGSYSYVANQDAADALDAGDIVTDSFNYTVSDGTATDIAVITITVIGVNDAPTALDNSITTNEDTNHVFSTGEFNFSDDDNSGSLNKIKITSLEDNGALQYYNGTAWVDVTLNQEITATDIANNKLRFKPDANENGSSYTSFAFQVSDGTAYSSSSSTMTINVTLVNDAPTARDDTGIVNEDARLIVSNSSDATSVAGASFVRSKSLGDAGYQSQETKFSPDGTKMFVLDTYQNTNEIHQYTLTTAFDISSASFDGADETFDLSNENSSSSNFTFNNDGTKFYSAYSGRLYEYDVSTAYDISTSSYNNNFFDLILEYPNTRNMGAGVNVAFNSDGTKLFALDAQQREVHEYSLSNAFDVTSASRTNNYVSVGTQEASPYGFAFSNDGKKMFISGFGADVNEYTLSTGFDLSSTFEFVGSFDVSSKDSQPFGITFNNDGTKMFVTGSQQDKLFEYSLTSPFSLIDVSGEHSGDVINTSSTDNYDTDPEGDALTVTTYSHTSATDQDGGSISSTSSTGTAGTNNVTGYYGTLDLEGNGSYTYTADLTVTQALDSGDTVTDVFTYTVDDGNGGTATATITITVIGMNDAPVAQNDVGVIVEDGTLRVTNSANANVSGSYDATGEHSGDVIDTSSSSHTDSDADASASLTVSAIRTGSSEGSGTAGSIGSALTGTYGQLTIAADGSYSYVANQDAAVGDSVTESFNYTLSDGTATDIGVITITILGVNDAGFIKEGGTLTVANSAAANSGASTGNHTGDITDNGSNITSITATTAGGNAQTTFSSNSETVIGEYGTLTINSDGSYSYVANSNISGLDAGDANIKDVFTYIVSDGSTTSTATLTMNIIASQDLTARDDNGTVNEDATLEVDDGDNLTTVAPASYDDSDSFTIAGSDSNPVTTQSTFNDLLFNPDGTKMYTLGSASGLSGRSLFQYTLSIPFDVSTASVSSDDNADVGGYELYNEAMRFNNDGTKLFVLNHPTHQSTRSYMYQYTLSTPYDITSTVTAGNSLLLGDQYDDFRTFLFNDDGSEMFIIETGYLIYKYTLSDPFDTSTASKTSSYLSAGNAVTGMQYNNDGTKLFTVHQTATIGSTAKILQWSLSTAYDLMTASSNVNWSDTSTYFDTGEATGSLGNGVPNKFITFNNDGSKFFSFNHTIGHGSSDPVKIKEWNLASPFNLTNDVSGEHSGDVINTSSTANYDTDPDSDTLTVTAIRTGSSEGLGYL
jgi:VCBS repeat-containing protein